MSIELRRRPRDARLRNHSVVANHSYTRRVLECVDDEGIDVDGDDGRGLCQRPERPWLLPGRVPLGHLPLRAVMAGGLVVFGLIAIGLMNFTKLSWTAGAMVGIPLVFYGITELIRKRS